MERLIRTASIVAALSVLLIAWSPIPVESAEITKVAPTEGEPGHPFTLIDTDMARLIDGSSALFYPTTGGSPVEVGIRTHGPYKTAQGRLPLSISGGDYDVVVRQPSGALIPIGSFHVIAAAAAEPTIQPTAGPVGTLFVITDPQARIRSGDRALFYLEGTDPSLGADAINVVISADGMTLTGQVPACTIDNLQHFVTVRPSLTEPSRFGDLPFFVTPVTNEAYIQPRCAPETAKFTITDPFGRMAGGQMVVFFAKGQSPSQGHISPDAVFTADGTQVTGTVPVGLAVGEYNVAVMVYIYDIPLFNSLSFFVTA